MFRKNKNVMHFNHNSPFIINDSLLALVFKTFDLHAGNSFRFQLQLLVYVQWAYFEKLFPYCSYLSRETKSTLHNFLICYNSYIA